MSVTDLLALLETRGIKVSLRGDDLAVVGDEVVLADQSLIASLRVNKRALIDLIREGQRVGANEDIVAVPANLIPDDANRIEPQMLTLVSLSQEAIDQIVAGVPGGAANVQDIYPLAPLQEGMLFHHLLHPESDVYTEGHLLAFRTRARLESFVSALQTVIDRHDILRTGIAWEGLERPVQVVRRRVELPVKFVDFDAAQGDIQQQFEACSDPRHHRFDLRCAPLLSCSVTHDVSKGRWLLRVLAHHIATDHVALELLVEETRAIEQGLLDQLPHPVPFRNFVAQARLGVSEHEHEAFFKQMLGDIDTSTAPFGLLDVRGGSEIIEANRALPQELSLTLRQHARKLGVSAASLMHLAWALVLARFTGLRDIVFGTVLFGRMQSAGSTDRMMGLLINTLPVRICVDAQSIQKRVKSTHDLLAQLLRHEHASLALAQRCSAIPPQTPLFTSLLNYRYSMQEGPEPAVSADEIEFLGGHERTNYPLTLSINDFGDGFSITAQVSEPIEPQRVCAFMQTALEQMLRSLQEAPQRSTQDVDVLPRAERERVLFEWNAQARTYPSDARIHELFERQAARTPDAVAVVQGTRGLSYSELNAQANRLAHYLRAQGVGPECRVAICMDRSVEMVMALLAILKAGGAYVPLDPAFASERLRATLVDSQPTVLLADEVGRQVLGHIELGSPVVDVQEHAARWARESNENPGAHETGVGPRHPAYVIYTSGSTGRPKGVMVEHAQVLRLFAATREEFGFTRQDVWTLFHSVAFDFSVWELWGALLYGGRLVIVPLSTARSPREFYELLCEQGVTVLNQTPSAFKPLIVAQSHSRSEHRLRFVIFGGEALELYALEPWYERTMNCGTQLVNMYGITETTVHVTYRPLCAADVERTGSSPIGVPLSDLRLYILDEWLRPVPIGVTGELYVGGAGLARGYLNQPELTAERFIADPCVEGGRLYKSGDLARWCSDGTVEYLGRNDFQVKVRGFRVELGEIEARLSQLQGVRAAVVVAREAEQPDVPADLRLVAYYTGVKLPVTALREHMKSGLPQYMVPAAFVYLDAIPLTPNGKLDRKALPAPEEGAYASRAYEAPQGSIEQTLARLWSQLLKVERVGRQDNFFDLGGHSLLAVQLISRIRQELQVEIALSVLFEHPELSALAKHVERGSVKPLPPIVRVSREGPLQMSLAQQRLWFLTRIEGAGAAYHIHGAVRLVGQLDRQALRQSLHRIVQRHETLRTCFVEIDGEPRQQVLQVGQVQWQQHLQERDGREESTESVLRQLAERAQVPFDLERQIPIRVLLLQLGEQEHLLQLVMHHIASDGWSVAVLLNELTELYGAYVQGTDEPLPELPIQYADYAAWQRGIASHALKAQSEHWRHTLSSAPMLLELPTDRPRPAEQDYAGSSVEVQLGERLSELVKQLSHRHGMTPYMTLLGSWAVLLGRLSRQREVVIGTPVAGRTRAEIEPLIGFFVNTLALRLNVHSELTVRQLLHETRAQVLSGQQHQDVPFDQVVEMVQPPRSLAHTPLFQVMFVWQNASEGDLRMPGLKVLPVNTPADTAQFDLTLALSDGSNGISGALNYATAIFDESTARRYVEYWRCLLESLLENDDRTLGELNLLPAAERDRVLYEWNDTAVEYPGQMLLHELFERQVRQQPGAIAVVHEEELTYEQLNARANQLAHYLRDLGVGPERLVGICLERSVEMVIAILGTLKAGGAYVPLDPAYPAERLQYMIEDSIPLVVLTQSGLKSRLPRVGAEVIALDEQGPATARQPVEDPDARPSGLTSRNLAYVIYTSGSTGTPKGVMIEHRNAVNFISWAVGAFSQEQLSRSSFSTSINFDLSVFELFAPLASGGTAVLVTNLISAGRSEQHPSLINTVPSAIEALAKANAIPARTQSINLAGEPLQGALVEALLRSSHVRRIANLYGPSETTTYSTWVVMDKARGFVPHIGRPIANTRVYILDAYGEPVPVGVAGEICIGGAGVARGYLKREQLTAERFLTDPYSSEPGARMYRTGDLGRWDEQGNIVFLGRNDHQVKIRGFRIEPGEIEAQLLRVEGVRQVAVIAREDSPGDKRLVAYVMSESSPARKLDAAALRGHLSAVLPEYMLPAAYIPLARLPLTQSGKVDRNALPAPDANVYAARRYEVPQGEIEMALARIWADLLKLDRVSRHAHFFESGGHSLLAVQLVSRLQRELECEAAIKDVFSYPVLMDLARVFESMPRGKQLPIMPVSRTQALPLSFQQQQLWLVAQLEGASLAYHMSMALRLNGALDTPALRQALDRIVWRHEVLRTTLQNVAGQAVQCVGPADTGFALQEHDLSGYAAPDDEADHRIREEPSRSFDLERGPLIRGQLLRLSESEHLLSITMHHIVSDGWSVGILFNELSQLYGAYLQRKPDPLEALPIQYADYAAWQRGRAGQVLQQQGEFWRNNLHGAPMLLELPTDRSRPAQQDYAGARIRVRLSERLSSALKQMSQRHGVTLFMTLLASWAVLLGRSSQQKEVVIGAPVAGRNRAEIEPLIGVFANMLALRVDVNGQLTVSELLERTKAQVLAGQQHQDLPFEQVVEVVQPPRSLAHTPLFQVVFIWHNTPVRQVQTPGLNLTLVDTPMTTAHSDLMLSLSEGLEGIGGLLNYATALFDEATVQRYVDCWACLLESLVKDESQRIGRLNWLPAAERERLLFEWNVTARTYPTDSCVHELFEAQVARTPDGLAVMQGTHRLSYSELNAQANQLAHHLRELGVGLETVVGLCVERSAQMLVGLLGILKAGGAYLPLDPDYPPDRLGYLINDAMITVLITQAALVERLPSQWLRLVEIDTDWPAIARQPADRPDSGARADNLAYIIYTSGSTGAPKGVMVEHRGVVNLAQAQIAMFGACDSSRVVQFASFAFDASVFEMMMALGSGAALLLPAREQRQAEALLDYLAENAVTHATLPPALLTTRPQGERWASLQTVVLAGEAPGIGLIKAFSPHISVFNAYGPTEATVWATTWLRPPGFDGVTVPMGRPIGNARIYVLDSYGEPVPSGMVGEIYIGGVGVARGYWNRPELTAERFLLDPFRDEPGARMYRSGDLARYRSDGELEFVGRNDYQVKIRGFRIELGEIEARLTEYPGVREAVVIARDDTPGEQRLVAYYTGMELPATALREHMKSGLPQYMVPAAFVYLDDLPLTPNGKLDRKALPGPEEEAYASRAYEAPQGSIEQTLARLWSHLLKVERVGRQDNFFDLGGHSLLAVQLISRIRQELQVEVTLSALFEHPHLAALAQCVGEGGPLSLPPIVRVERSGPQPLSLAQQRLWFLTQIEGGSAAYHIHGAVRLGGELDQQALGRALHRIVQRHETLRTCFCLIDGTPQQRIWQPEQVQPEQFLQERDLRGQLPSEAQRLGAEHAQTPFDLERELPVRALLLRLADQEYLFQVVMHHIASDGWSVGILLNELSQLYGAYLQRKPDPLAALPIQYADFSAWQRVLAQQVLQRQSQFWRNNLHGAPMLLELPTDRSRPAQQDYAGSSIPVRLGERLSGAVKQISQHHGMTVFMTLLASWAVLLGRSSQQQEVVVGTPVAGRNRAEVEPLIGFFVNTLALRVDVNGQLTVSELLERTKAQVLAGQQHQDLPFEQVVEVVQPPRSLAHTPLFQVVFAWQNAPDGQLQMPGLRLAPVDTPVTTAQFDLTLSLTEGSSGIVGVLNYATALFDQSTVQHHLDCWLCLLESLVSDASQRVGLLSWLPAAERERVLFEWNATARAYSCGSCVHELFEAQVQRTPEATALAHGDSRMSYQELNSRANQMARYLRGKGVGSGDLVALSLERGMEMVIGLLGILKAGGAYVPIDPAYPSDRVAYMLVDSRPKYVLSQDSLDAHGSGIAAHEAENLQPAPQSPRQLAYVIYTSGSTGRPKGVMVEHRNVVNLMDSMRTVPGICQDDVLLSVTSMSFDIAALEIFLPLLNGACVVIASRPEATDPQRLKALIERWQVSIMQATPSTWHMLTQHAWPELPCPLKVLCGGEALPPHVAERLLDHVPEVWNLYGPTETTIWSTVQRVTCVRADIGRPIANTRICILDERLQPVPAGIRGELYIGGAGVARGYSNQPALTAERFIADPFVEDGRLYKTGDLGRWRQDGSIEYLGRNDFQVKVRGFRIELGEVEARLCELEGVRQAVVLVREDSPGEPYLAAYHTGTQLAAEKLREQALSGLPHYMVPAVYIHLDDLPLTPNGKLDRKALTAPDANPGRTYESPQGHIEQTMATLWSQLLDVERVGRHDNFFELGGHSLLAVQLVARIRRELGVDVSATVLFRHVTLRALAETIAGSAHTALPTWLTPFRSTGSARPLFFLHPGLGESTYVGALLPGIDAQIPVYGVSAIGFLPGEQPLQTVEEMAAVYIGAIREVQPRGPYRLAGWSAGGTIAFEIARQLLSVDETIEFMGLIDTPSRLPPVDPTVLGSVLSFVSGVVPEALLTQLIELAARDDTRGMLLACQAAAMLPADVPVDVLERYLAVRHAIKVAILSYSLPSLPVTATLFVATEENERNRSVAEWDALADEVIRIPMAADHMSIVQPPHAAQLGRRISEAIATSHVDQ